MTTATRFSVNVPVEKLAKAKSVSATYTGIVNGVPFTSGDTRSFAIGGPSKPVVTQPVVTQPVVTQPVVTKPVVTKPVVTQPVVTKPVVTVSGGNVKSVEQLRLGNAMVNVVDVKGKTRPLLTIGRGKGIPLVKRQPKGGAIRIKSYGDGIDLYIKL